MNRRQPTLFISHGSPMLALEDGPAHRFLATLGKRLEKPDGIVVISAHYEEDVPTVTANPAPPTIHDFGGFPRALFEMSYPAPGSPSLANAVRAALSERGIASRANPTRGLDHGAWVPLSLAYPAADIPVIELSIDPRRDAAHHYALGKALVPLRDRNVLVIGSGSITHNLRELSRPTPDAPVMGWAADFTEWVHDAATEGRLDDLMHFEERAPEPIRAHPTDEHFLPFFAALGAGDGDAALRLHHSFAYGSLGMDTYAFGDLRS